LLKKYFFRQPLGEYEKRFAEGEAEKVQPVMLH
jgi:hypothetical protein